MPDSALKTCNSCGRKYQTVEDFFANTSRWRMCQNRHLWFNCSCNSTNMILKGKFDWYAPDAFLSRQAKSLFNTIPRIRELPQLPTYVMELQQLIQKEGTTARQLAEVSQKAPMLASKVLELANRHSAQQGSKIESLEHAISYIGIATLQDIILVASLQSIEIHTKIFSLDEFWEDSFQTGRVAEFLARRYASHLIQDKAYIAGTLCNIGKLVLAIYAPEKADQIAKDIKDHGVLGSWQDGELRHNIPAHTILGEIGGCFWGMPEYVLNGIMLHHQVPKFISKKSKISFEGLIALANQINHWVQLKPSEINQEQLEGWLKVFELDSKQVELLVAEILQEIKAA